MENNGEVPPLEEAAGPRPPEPVTLTPDPLTVRNDTQLRLLDAVKEHDRAICAAHAARAAAVDEIMQWTRAAAETGRPTTTPAPLRGGEYVEWSSQKAADEGLVAELACLLTLPEGTARNLMCHSQLLQHKLPATRDALARGDISYRHVEVILENVLALPDEAWKAFEQEALTDSETLTVPQFKKKAIKLRELTHPESIRVRHERALADRCFYVNPGRDGMGYLEMTLSNEDANAIADRVEAMAKKLVTSSSLVEPVETRTLSQLRTDVAVDLLLQGVTATGPGAGIRGNVYVTVPVLTLMGQSEEPGTLEGVGPIDTETARRIAGTATSFTRVLVHPETGAVLSVGRTKYKVPKDLRRWLQLRDGSRQARPANAPPAATAASRTATSTTPSPGNKAAKPPSPTSPTSAAGSRQARPTVKGKPAGRSNKTNTAPSPGPAQPASITPPTRQPASDPPSPRLDTSREKHLTDTSTRGRSPSPTPTQHRTSHRDEAPNPP